MKTTDRWWHRRRRGRDDAGYSAVELVMYMPLLMIGIILVVQFALVYLGNEAVSAAAREASRTARVTGNAAEGEAKGVATARDLGGGLVDNVNVTVTQINEGEMRTVVTADGVRLLPWIDIANLDEEVQGPIERFVEDQ